MNKRSRVCKSVAKIMMLPIDTDILFGKKDNYIQARCLIVEAYRAMGLTALEIEDITGIRPNVTARLIRETIPSLNISCKIYKSNRLKLFMELGI